MTQVDPNVRMIVALFWEFAVARRPVGEIPDKGHVLAIFDELIPGVLLTMPGLDRRAVLYELLTLVDCPALVRS